MSDHQLRLQGIACAVAAFMRTTHGCTVVAADMLNGMGVSLAELKAAGADSYDMQALRELRDGQDGVRGL